MHAHVSELINILHCSVCKNNKNEMFNFSHNMVDKG